MSGDACPFCGETDQIKRYNKWHVREIYCANCHRCLNPDYVQKQTQLAQQASREGKLVEFELGGYVPAEDGGDMSSEYKSKYLEMMMPGNHSYQIVFGVVFIVIWILDSFLLRVTTFLTDQIYFWIPLIPAVLILIVSLYLIDASHKDLFDSGSFGLKTQGVFSKVRHPMYLGTALFYLTLAVATISLASILVFFLILLGYNHIANYEEEKLLERFGDDYVRYKETVGKWFPH